MKKTTHFLTALLLLCLSLPIFAVERWLSCRVVGISDGDSITCLLSNNKQIKVRLQEIDAPERAQAFGKRARQTLAQLIHKQQVQLSISGYDRYHRTLATIYLGQQNINLRMVELGMAWAYRQYMKDPRYLAAQQQAQSRRIGLWSDPSPIPPQEFRRQKRGAY